MSKRLSSSKRRLLFIGSGLLAALALAVLAPATLVEDWEGPVATIGYDPVEENVQLPSNSYGGHVWKGPDGNPLPFQTDDEICDFLLTANPVSRKSISTGINRIDKVILEKDGIQLAAAYRDVKVKKANVRLADGTFYLDFRDDAIFELAAYRISRLLGITNVPPVVARKLYGSSGTLQVWVEEAMTEKKRTEERIQPPDPARWQRQVQSMYLFDQLIANDDRNLGNILIDTHWDLWMIDHTRAFRKNKKPETPQVIIQVETELWTRLQSTSDEDFKKALRKVLTGPEISTMLKRRQELIHHLQTRIERVGEDGVVI